MNVFIERLDLPINKEWSRFLSPLQSSHLTRAPVADPNQEARFLVWGVQIHQETAESGEIKCGALVGKLIEHLVDDGEWSLFLSVVSIVFAAPRWLLYWAHCCCSMLWNLHQIKAGLAFKLVALKRVNTGILFDS